MKKSFILDLYYELHAGANEGGQDCMVAIWRQDDGGPYSYSDRYWPTDASMARIQRLIEQGDLIFEDLATLERGEVAMNFCRPKYVWQAWYSNMDGSTNCFKSTTAVSEAHARYKFTKVSMPYHEAMRWAEEAKPVMQGRRLNQ